MFINLCINIFTDPCIVDGFQGGPGFLSKLHKIRCLGEEHASWYVWDKPEMNRNKENPLDWCSIMGVLNSDCFVINSHDCSKELKWSKYYSIKDF